MADLDNCIKIATKTLEDSIETGNELDLQGDKIKHITVSSDDIKRNVSKAHSILNRMLSYVGIFKKKPTDKNIENIKYTRVNSRDRFASNSNNCCIEVETVNEDSLLVEETCSDKLILEREKKLDTLYKITQQLKEVNISIGNSLTDHNDTLDNLHEDTVNNILDVRSASRKINKIIV